MSFRKNFYEFFITPDNESKEWDNKLFEYAKLKNIEKFREHLDSAKEIYFQERQIYTAINTFTLKDEPEEEKNRLLRILGEEDFVDNVEFNDSKIIIKLPNATIKAYTLSKKIPELKEDFPDIETVERKDQCHIKSMIISDYINAIPNSVVTGFIFGFSDKAKYLHSWVEFNNGEEDMVIDYTLNILMNKEGYYLIQNAIPLSKIPGKLIHEDRKMLDKFDELGLFNEKEYLLFRDEIMKALSKNKQIFDNER